jgi:hypothetical protein
MDASIENKLLQEQLLQEAFLDSVKAYAQDKYNRVVDKISDWKDAAAVIGNVISDPEILQRFSDDVWYNFKAGTLKRLIALLNKIGLGNLVASINEVITKITSLTGWQKFLAATGIGAIAEYIVDKMARLAPDTIKNFIASYLSESGLKSIISKLTDFKSYLGWLQPIIKGVDMLYQVMKPSIDKFGTGIFTNKINLVRKENKIMVIKEYIKDIVREIISEDELEEMSVSGDAGAYSTPYAFRGNKKGENAATKAAISQGFKKASTSLPKNSKVVDYKQLFEDEYEMKQDPKQIKLSDKDKETIKKIQALIAKEKNKKLREGNDWPEEVLSRHKDMKFIKQKSFSDKATYQIIDLEDNNKSKGTMTFSSVNNLKDFADDYIKPQGGTISTHLGENNINENYSKFRNETKTRSKSEHYHKAILEVKKRTNELNKLLEYAIRLKQELNQVDEIKSSRHTLNALDKVTENIKEVYIKAKKLK